MPCDSGPSLRDRQDMDTMARLACLYCRELEESDRDIPKWARDWWARHQAYDEQRQSTREDT